MNPGRAKSYRRVMATLSELGPSKLQPGEIERVRSAADTLLFAHDLTEDPGVVDALLDAEKLCRELVDCGRWTAVTARRLADDVYACGPGQETSAERQAA